MISTITQIAFFAFSTLVLWLATGSTATADTPVIAVGRLADLSCSGALRSVAKAMVEREAGEQGGVALAYLKDWEDALLETGSHPDLARASQTCVSKWDEIVDVDEILLATIGKFQAMAERGQVALAVVQRTSGRPPIAPFVMGLRETYLVHSTGADQVVYEPEKSELKFYEQIEKEKGPTFLIFIEGFDSNPPGLAGLFYAGKHHNHLLYLMQQVFDLELISAWAVANAKQRLAGKEVDSLFKKYGKMVDKKPSIDEGFITVFTKSRKAAVAGALAVSGVGGKDKLITQKIVRKDKAQMLLETIPASGPDAVRVMDAEDLDSENFVRRGMEWAEEMEKTTGKKPR